MTKRNMKIEINESQPINEVVAELGRLGYECKQFYFHIDEHKEKCKFKSVVCYCSGRFYYYVKEVDDIFGCELTTLDELKQMV